MFTRYVYDDGHMTQMWVDIDGDGTQDAGVDQVTVYTFGVPKGTSAGQSNIASNSLLYKVAYASGSISNRTRQENWTLDQVGNWDFYTKDSNGDLDFTDAGELYEDRTHNVVNELTARDTDDNGTDNYTFDYDAVGNMLSDGEKYKMVYNVWGQLVTVKNQSATVIAVYTYYGNGHRASAREDTDSDGDSDGSDVTRYFAYAGWCIAATFLDSDPDAKELFVNHNAGLGGFGGAYTGIGGYIDHVVCRLVDRTNGIYGTPDGTLEVTEYSCQNWRADVAALLSVAGKMLERGKDSAYGLRFSSPSGDTDSDGDMDASDESNIGGGSYELRKDADLDGDFDAADVTHAKSITGGYQTLGWGVSSSAAIANRKTWAGYEKAGLDLFDVRNRFFHLPAGRWTRRDPLGYVDGPNHYSYVRGFVITYVDAYGLCALGNSNTGASTENITRTHTSQRTTEQCCADILKITPPQEGFFGITFCCDGRAVMCVWDGQIEGELGDQDAAALMTHCVRNHELEHFQDIDCGNPPITTRRRYRWLP